MRACRHCGAPVATKHGIPSCKSCQRERDNRRQRANYKAKHKLRDGLRRCRRCRRWRSAPSQIAPRGWVCKRCQLDTANRARRRRMKTWNAERREAERQRFRETRQRTRSTPEGRAKHNAANQRWRLRHPGAAYAAHKRWIAKIRKDPKRWAQHKEDIRIYHRLYRERKGVPLRPVSIERYRNGNGKTTFAKGKNHLDASVLAPYIEQWLSENSGGDPGVRFTRWHGRTPAGVEQLAERAQVPSRRIFAILHGEQENVLRATADALCVAMAVPLALLYPEDRESA